MKGPSFAGVVHRLPSRRTRSRDTRSSALIAEEPAFGSEATGEELHGLVVRAHGLWYEVAIDGSDEILIATIRGNLKRRRQRTDIVAVGDRVTVTPLPDNEAVITAIEPRLRALVRTARHTRDTDQVILANPDQVLFVFAARQPEPHLRMLDRFIILAERQEIPIHIAVTKMDLVESGIGVDPREQFAEHAQIFPVHFISARSGQGMDELKEALHGKISGVAGPSGVGKSSLLNILDPENERETSHVSEATGKGRHTTVGARIHRLDQTTFVADTPGMRALAMHAVPQQELDWYFREFRPYLGQCFYPDCSHIHEPGCAIMEARDEGKIGPGRYQSYAMLRTGDEIGDAELSY